MCPLGTNGYTCAPLRELIDPDGFAVMHIEPADLQSHSFSDEFLLYGAEVSGANYRLRINAYLHHQPREAESAC